jgi:hypothetical protein
MLKIITSAVLIAMAVGTASRAAHAGSFAAGCTKEPSSAWKATETSAAKAVSLGYIVSKTKTTGTCHEIYATKGGQRFELFFNPVTNDLVHTAAK